MQPITRRSLLVGACAIASLGLTALPAAADSTIKRLPNGRVSVEVQSIPELAKVGGAVSLGNVKGQPVGLARTGPSTYRAFSLRCPHQGVTVNRDASGWICRAHGSEFTADGGLVRGPAKSGLAKVRSRMKQGQVIVG